MKVINNRLWFFLVELRKVGSNCILAGVVLLFLFVGAALAESEDTNNKQTTGVSNLNYQELEPSQLFQILSDTYHVQFEGADTVTGTITLISKENETVDLEGMLKLLNDRLRKQNKGAQLDGHTVRIVPVQTSEDRVIKLLRADPEKVVEILKNRFMDVPEDQPGTEKPILIKVHPQGGAILIRGSANVLSEMTKYIYDNVDIAIGDVPVLGGGQEEQVTRYITLNNAPARQVAKFLQEAYLAKPGDDPADAADKAQRIIAHPQLPKILLIGPAPTINAIEKLIKDELDVPAAKSTGPPKPPMKRKYISLEYMDAIEFNELLAKDTTLSDKEDKLISVVAPNNTLIVSTRYPDEIFPRIDEMLKAFDQDRMEIRYRPLRYAKAADVTKLINDVYGKVQAEGASLPEELQRIRKERIRQGDDEGILTEAMRAALADAGIAELGALDLLSRAITPIVAGEVTIVPDISGNALLIYTFSRNFPKIEELLEELDQPVDQVFIDVFITMVSLDDTLDLGVDYSFNDNMEYRNRQYTLGQNFNTFLQTTGLNYQLVSSNLNAYLHALQVTGKLDIISQPSIMTNNNSKAVIALGNKVPIIEKVTVSTEGLTSSQVKYVDVTTSLEVTPQIHPDGYVSMEILQKIDDISAETVQISRDFNPQVLIKREAKTTLRVKDGQTVCLGGFISDDIIENEDKVPLLGDIPLLGYLFKYSSQERIKQELIIFITPHIIKTPTEMLRMTNVQRQQSNTSQEKGRGKAVLEIQEELRVPPFKDPPDIIVLPEEPAR